MMKKRKLKEMRNGTLLIKKLEETKSKYYNKWRDKILSKNTEIEKKLLPGSTKPRQTEIVRFSVPHRSDTSHVI